MLRLLPLGGLGEVGMNCLALAQRGEAILVDCGVTFDDRALGVDVVHPDFGALEPGVFAERLAGVVITHGHEDHIGALPYLLRRHDVPVFGPPYALGLVRERLDEHEVLRHARLIETRPREPFTIGSFRVEPIRVTHSIADATALAITTDAGVVVHTGDFKFDPAPPDGEAFDEARLAELGDAGVRLLLSDSTNIDAEGASGGEAGVGDALERAIAETEGAVVVAMFASNVHRLRLLGEVARRHGRRIVLLGRGVGTHARVARKTGYLPWPDGLVAPEAALRELPRSKILAIATGSQGEERAALARLARGEQRGLDLGPGDTVVLSARAIPGNEPTVQTLIGALLRRGCAVRTRASDRGIHVSGHAHRGEQQRMLELVRPRAFVPVHGTLAHLTRHAELARSCGVGVTAVAENGRVLELTGSELSLGETLPTGRVHVWGGKEVPEAVLRDRSSLAEDGVASCTVTISSGSALFGPRVTEILLDTRGVLDERAFPEELDAAREAVKEAVREALDRPMRGGPPPSDEALADVARLAVRRSFQRSRGRKPVTIARIRRTA